MCLSNKDARVKEKQKRRDEGHHPVASHHSSKPHKNERGPKRQQHAGYTRMLNPIARELKDSREKQGITWLPNHSGAHGGINTISIYLGQIVRYHIVEIP